MKKTIIAISFLFIATSQANAETCMEKIADIQKKIEHAKVNGTGRQLKGLEKALAYTKSHCTESKLAEDHQNKIKEKEADLKEAIAELDKAKADQKSTKKIEEKQNKVNEKTKELEALKATKG